MARILVNECKQEISSFNPALGQYEDFAVSHGEAILTLHRGIGTEIGGALQVFDEIPGIEVIGGFSARAITSGGPSPTQRSSGSRASSSMRFETHGTSMRSTSPCTEHARHSPNTTWKVICSRRRGASQASAFRL